MRFRKVQTLRGPNIWAKFPVLEAWVDLEELKDSSSDAMPGFNDRLMAWLPSLYEHRCSVGQPGGFFERLRRGTYLAHILEHVALELQSLAGSPTGYGRTRQANDDGVYKVALEYHHEEVGYAALEAGRRLCLAAVHNTPFDVAVEVEALRQLRLRLAPSAGVAPILQAARDRNIPVVRLDENNLIQLGYGHKQQRILNEQLNTAPAVAEAIAEDRERTWNLLYSAGVPVPGGCMAHSAEAAWKAAQNMEAPVMIRPRFGAVPAECRDPLTGHEDIVAAYNAAARAHHAVLVERAAEGTRWQVLVVGARAESVLRYEQDKPMAYPLQDVHAEFLAQAVDAAETLGLNLAAVDIIARDPAKPLECQGGVVVAVSSRPSIAEHITTDGAAARIGPNMLDLMFPPGETGRVPIVAVTGTNGKTTTVRLVTHVLSHVHAKVGMTCTEGIYVGNRRVATGDCSGPQSARTVLQHPLVDAAVLEAARGGILRAGLGFDLCDVGIVTNIGEGDHLGASEIDTADQLAYVKSVVVAAVAPHGTAVLNAADPLVVDMAKYSKGSVTYFSMSPDNPVVVAHRAKGGRAVFVRDGSVTLAVGANEEPLVPLGRIPLTHGGLVSFHVENVLAAVAACHSLRVPKSALVAGLETFAANLQLDPGRFNLLQIHGALVVLDYGHNADALFALIRSVGKLPCERRTIVYSSSGDRRTVDLERQGEILGNGFDRVILYEDPRYLRGIEEGGIMRALQAGLSKGHKVRDVIELRCWEEAARTALQSVGEGDVLVLQPDVMDETVEFINQYLQNGSGREVDIAEVLAEPHPDQVVVGSEDGPGVEIRQCETGQGVYALRAFTRGEEVLRAFGTRTTQRTRLTIQTDFNEHVLVPPPVVLINHSCDPNCGVQIRRGVPEVAIFAMRDLQPGEALSIDYSTFESSVEYFEGPCLCRTPICRGRIAGYDLLPDDRREAYGIYIADYLRESPQQQPTAGRPRCTPAGAR
jgi:cyanophycin synthetase